MPSQRIPVILLTPDGKVIYKNPAALNILRAPRKGGDITKFLEDETALNKLMDACASGRDIYQTVILEGHGFYRNALCGVIEMDGSPVICMLFLTILQLGLSVTGISSLHWLVIDHAREIFNAALDAFTSVPDKFYGFSLRRRERLDCSVYDGVSYIFSRSETDDYYRISDIMNIYTRIVEARSMELGYCVSIDVEQKGGDPETGYPYFPLVFLGVLQFMLECVRKSRIDVKIRITDDTIDSYTSGILTSPIPAVLAEGIEGMTTLCPSERIDLSVCGILSKAIDSELSWSADANDPRLLTVRTSMKVGMLSVPAAHARDSSVNINEDINNFVRTYIA